MIEITPEMAAAGAEAIFEWRALADSWELAKEVYRAMERVAPRRLRPHKKPALSEAVGRSEGGNEGES